MLCDRCRRELPAPRIVVTTAERRLLIDPWDVVAIEARDKGVLLHPQGLWEQRMLCSLVETYPQIFVATSRYWAVQPDLVSAVRLRRGAGTWRYRSVVVGDLDIPVSRRCWPAVSRRLSPRAMNSGADKDA